MWVTNLLKVLRKATEGDFEHTYELDDWRWPATSGHESYRSSFCIP